MALHFYAEGQYEVLQLKRENSTLNGLFDEAENKLMFDLKSCKKANLTEKEIETAKKIVRAVKRDLSKNLFTEFEWIEKLGLGDFTPCFSYFAYTCSEIAKAYKIIPFMDKALKNQLIGNTILYRGISKEYIEEYFGTQDLKSIVGRTMKDKGYSSTSLLFNSSYGYNSPIFVTLKLYVPKGTEGLDVTNFSSFDTENEILLNSNEIYIMDYKEYSPNCIILTCFVLSKNIECYKDIGLPPQNLSDDEKE